MQRGGRDRKEEKKEGVCKGKGGEDVERNESAEEEEEKGDKESRKMTVWMKFQRGAERCREREEERRKRERKETEKRDEEQRRERRRKNVIWKGIEGEDEEAIGVIISRITRDATGEKKEIRRLEKEKAGGK